MGDREKSGGTPLWLWFWTVMAFDAWYAFQSSTRLDRIEAQLALLSPRAISSCEDKTEPIPGPLLLSNDGRGTGLAWEADQTSFLLRTSAERASTVF